MPISIAIVLNKLETVVNRIVNITDRVHRFVYKYPTIREMGLHLHRTVQILKRMNLDTSEEDSFSNFV